MDSSGDVQLAYPNDLPKQEVDEPPTKELQSNWTSARDADLHFVAKSSTRWTPCALFDCWRDDDPDLPKRCTDATGLTDYSGTGGYPPCCVHLLRDLLDEFAEFLQSKNTSFFLHYGTLLGAHRGKEIIPWTPDVDVAIHFDDFRKLTDNLILRGELYDRGMSIFREGDRPEWHMGRLCMNRHWRSGALLKFPASLSPGLRYYDRGAYMDLYMIKKMDNGMMVTPNGPCTFYQKWIFPLGNVTIGNKAYPAPGNIDAVLNHIYGPNWRTPSVARDTWECELLIQPEEFPSDEMPAECTGETES